MWKYFSGMSKVDKNEENRVKSVHSPKEEFRKKDKKA